MAKEEFFKDVDIEDVIDYFGVDDILDSISRIDIAKYCDDFVLSCIDDDSLIAAISDEEKVLESFDTSSIIEYLRDLGYYVSNYDENDKLLKLIKNICRIIKPKGIIDKEDAKKILCDYLDNWMTKSF